MAAKSQPVVGVDEGSVFTGPNPDGVYVGPVEGEDRAGFFDGPTNDEGIVLTPQNGAQRSENVATVSKSKSAGKPVTVFTNTKFPEQKIALVTEKNGQTVRTGRRIEFHSTKLMTDDPEVVAQIEALNRPYIFREPANFLALDQDDEKFFRHRDTGFKTLVKKAYEDWVDNSEWAARPK